MSSALSDYSIVWENEYIMRIYLLAALLLVCPFSYASTVVWHQQYYPGVSKVTHLPTTYCEQTTPGIFIGTVELQLKNGALTDK